MSEHLNTKAFGGKIRRKNRVDCDADMLNALEKKLEDARKQLSDIAKAIKPLRDWYFVHNAPSEKLVIAEGYGHAITVGDVRKLIDACPQPGSIVDTHA